MKRRGDVDAQKKAAESGGGSGGKLRAVVPREGGTPLDR
jgi:hypothetical protein